ncbi:hypothetical protein A264_24570 [Pseudomonas syringae pv. actinidiae ICMP 19071]|nr:hypothetical protein A264_24570 [Pseudomonas syringae pv. actinidiae ICMP 19071]EPM74733.1 hypothetical protein A3SO_24181 [Pseudomonas syringae pv. actinidiae ICMP 19072]
MLAVFFRKVFERADTRFFDFRMLLSIVAKRKTFTCESVFFIPIHDEVYKRMGIDFLNVFVVFKIKACDKARVWLQADLTPFQKIVLDRFFCFLTYFFS